jgi:membrane-bound serine protease (ClpP class)
MGKSNQRVCDLFGRGPMLARLLSLSLLLVLTLFSVGQGTPGPSAVPAARQANNIAVITIKGGIDETTARSVARRIDLAERAGANAMVVELDTPGGRLDAVLAICNAIRASSITNTVAWVNRDAYSGGAIIAIACREIIVNDPSTLGDAIPIALSMIGTLNTLPETERQKALAPLISELVSSARRNGYDELLVQGIASRGVELWLVENKATGQRVCITRDEYGLLFGEEPVAGAPGLASAPTVAPSESPSGPSGMVEQISRYAEKFQKPRSGQREAGKPTKVEEAPLNTPNQFIPGAPGMEAIAGRVSGQLELPPARPVFTSAEQGKWTLLEYVSSGAGPFVFKSDQMLHYRLATKVVKDDEELKAHFGAKSLLRLDQSWSEGLVALLTWLPIRGLLIVIFLIALFVEMTHPGLVAPGGIAAAALIALIAPPLLINMANWWEIAAILTGIVLVALEIFVLPGFGVAGILGLLLLFGGLIGTFVPQGSFFPDSANSRNDMLYGVATLVMAVVTSGVAMYFISKNFKSLPLFGKLVLRDPAKSDDSSDDMLAAMAPTTGPVKKGMLGMAMTPLRPAGRVELPGGRIIDAVADMGFIPTGSRVRVTSVSEFRIGVEKAEA